MLGVNSELSIWCGDQQLRVASSFMDLRDTRDEEWTLEPTPPSHPYRAAADRALRVLEDGRGRSCLVIGSPPFEAELLQAAGWLVLFLDCRQPPPMSCSMVIADATKMPFADASFDAASTTCVLCHAGLGRYGDAEREDGDALMLKEMARVLRPGARAAVVWGPSVAGQSDTFVLGKTHRVYHPRSAALLALAAGLPPEDGELWGDGRWLTGPEIDARPRIVEELRDIPYSYLAMTLRKG